MDRIDVTPYVAAWRERRRQEQERLKDASAEMAKRIQSEGEVLYEAKEIRRT
jgi:hypothetical protein